MCLVSVFASSLTLMPVAWRARMQHLYGIGMLPIPSRQDKPSNKPPSGRILKPISVQIHSVRAEIWLSIHQCYCLHPSTAASASLAKPSSCTKGWGLWYPGFAASLSVLTDVPCSSPLGCTSWGPGWSCPLPPHNFHLNGASMIMSSTSQSLHWKHLIPLWLCLSQLFLLLPSLLLLFWFLALPGGLGLLHAVICGLWIATCNCTIYSLKLIMLSLPSDWADLFWTPSPDLSFCWHSAF